MPPKKKSGRSRSSSPKRKAKSKAAGVDAQKLASATITLPPVVTPRAQALQGCVAQSDIRTLSRLVTHYNHETALTAVDVNGSTPIHLACRKGDARMLTHLLSYNIIDVNAKEKRAIGGYAALHHACAAGCIPIVQLLLSYGANVNIRAESAMGEMPLHICCKIGSIECARLLLTAGAHPDARDNFGNNASFWAIQKHNADMISVLGLPPGKSASADEYLKLLMEKNGGKFALPKIKAKGKGKKDGKKGGGKKKK